MFLMFVELWKQLFSLDTIIIQAVEVYIFYPNCVVFFDMYKWKMFVMTPATNFV